jgi:CBS domain containing-hemolysin-like protein
MSGDLALVLLLAAVVGSAFFSGCETGLMAVSRVRLQRRHQAGDHRVTGLSRLRENLDDAILTCLLGTNLSNVMASAVATALLVEMLGRRGEGVAVLVVSVVLAIFGEIVPKILYREFPERLMLYSLPPLRAFQLVVWPVRWLLGHYAALLQRLQRADTGQAPGLDAGALAMLLSTNAEDARDRRFRLTMGRFLRLSNRRVSDLMRPLASVRSVPSGVTMADALAEAARSGFSRLPVQGTGGDLEGYLLARDLLLSEATAPTHEPVPVDLIRALLLVDASLSPYELFEELHARRAQLAAVVDRDGRALGIVTLEDLIEKVTGAIADEFDQPEEIR